MDWSYCESRRIKGGRLVRVSHHYASGLIESFFSQNFLDPARIWRAPLRLLPNESHGVTVEVLPVDGKRAFLQAFHNETKPLVEGFGIGVVASNQ